MEEVRGRCEMCRCMIPSLALRGVEDGVGAAQISSAKASLIIRHRHRHGFSERDVRGQSERSSLCHD